MHTNFSTQADQAIVPLKNPNELFFHILKRVTLRRDANALVATRADVQSTLQFYDLTDTHQKSVLDSRQWRNAARASPQAEFEELMESPLGDSTLTLHPSAKQIVQRLLAMGSLRLRYPEVLARQKTQRLFDLIHQAVMSIPGQAGLAERVAADLTTQLSSEDRQQTARLLLHGDTAWGCHETLYAIAQTLATHEGYKVVVIDCSAYRSDGEAASWDGAKSYWSGSGTGQVTEPIYKHGKVIFLFLRFDETVPKVQGTLNSALLTGEMVDHHGLEDQEELNSEGPRANSTQRGKGRYRPTTVNCRHAIFLFAVAHGTQWLMHRDAPVILGDTTAQQGANLIKELENAVRENRGETTPLFDVTVLRQLSNHHHVMMPLRWQTLEKQAQSSMTAVLNRASTVLGVKVQFASISVANSLASLALCHQGAEMALTHTQPEALFRVLIQPLHATQLTAGQHARKCMGVTLDFDETALQNWVRIQAQLGADPMETLCRQNQFVDFSLGLEEFGSWQVTQVALKTVRRLSDYAGASGLVSHIPKETLADVAGHESAKTFLFEIVGYLKSPEVLAKYGVHMPRGVVLYGPPGTGKTLIAKGLAGQAQIPFIAAAGSDLLNADFRARLLKIAHRAEPCIVFIDEVDAWGRRGQHSHAHDATIDAFLSAVDGFFNSRTFYVLTTNRPEEIDPALTRPGRIDRSFEIGKLDVNGREACLARLWPMLDLPDTELMGSKERIVKLTYGMTGAELALLHREVALRLARQAQSIQVDGIMRAPLTWVIEEISRIQHGDAHERHACEAFRYRVAIHEAGHVLLHHLLMPNLRIVQVSITPRAGSAGFVALSSEGASKVYETASAVRSYIAVLLGGRAAEILVLGTDDGPSVGASSDLALATEAALKAVAFAGFDENFGNASLAGLMIEGKAPQLLHEAAARLAMQWVEKARHEALMTLTSMRGCLDAIVCALLARETLEGNEVTDIVNGWRLANAHTKTVCSDARQTLTPALQDTN
jgi:cell division protease FtsH